jgi:hypothetical protein
VLLLLPLLLRQVAGELSNFINRDLRKIYPDRAKAMRCVCV